MNQRIGIGARDYLAVVALGAALLAPPAAAAAAQTYNAAAQRGRDSLRAGDASAARESFQRAFELTDQVGSKAAALFGVGASYELEKAHEQARQVYGRIRDLPGADQDPVLLARVQWSVALTHHQEGERRKAVDALALLQGMAGVGPEMASDAWHYTGDNLKALGRYPEALKAYGRELEVAGNPVFHRSRALLEMADTYCRAHDLQAALDTYAKVLPLKPIPIRHRSLARHEMERIRAELAKQ
ncbi:MAG: hypothetical protein HY321_12240 [Armatimonadetes bacterium]|nr:hypothetical protein [Armatimonadota bacterium]